MTDIPRAFDINDCKSPFDWGLACSLDVYLDGVLQRSVRAYDLDAGTVTRMLLDKDGKAILSPDGRRVEWEKVSGSIDVVLKEQPVQS